MVPIDSLLFDFIVANILAVATPFFKNAAGERLPHIRNTSGNL
jgi:hypothetical protein